MYKGTAAKRKVTTINKTDKKKNTFIMSETKTKENSEPQQAAPRLTCSQRGM